MANITIRTNKKGELQAKIQVSYKDPDTGQNKLKSKRIYNTDNLTESKFKKQAKEEATIFESEVITFIENKNSPTRVLTFMELATEWKHVVKASLSYSYYERVCDVSVLFDKYLKTRKLDKRPISDITVRDVQLFFNECLKPKPTKYWKYRLIQTTGLDIPPKYEGKLDSWTKVDAMKFCRKNKLSFEKTFEVSTTTRTLSLTTVKGYRQILRTLFNEAVRYDWISKNPVCSAKVTASNNNSSLRALDEKEVFSNEEIRQFLQCLDNIKDECPNKVVPLKIMLFAGLRSGEVHGLKWSDIDFDKKLIHVRRARMYNAGIGCYEKLPKTKTSLRDVPIPDYLVNELNDFKEWFRIVDPEFDDKLDEYYLVVNLYREPTYARNLSKWLSDFEERNGLRFVTCHGLRHTYCSMLLSQNVPIQTVCKYMGHSDSTVTLQIYSHFMPETQNIAINALNLVISEVV